MAIFGTKKNTTAKKAVTKAVKTVKAVKTAAPAVIASTGIVASVSDMILRPRITEKSGILSQTGVYTFEIAKNANKILVSKAVVALYKVTPIKVTIINSPAKKVFIRGRRGVVSGVRKALVTLKEGDKIDFV